MMAMCGAGFQDGKIWRNCIFPDKGGHEGGMHQDRHRKGQKEPVRWPTCSQFCAQDHVHGEFRRHMGTASGPAKIEDRAPRRRKAGKVPAVPTCRTCLQPEPLTKGVCTDRVACAERAPVLF